MLKNPWYSVVLRFLVDEPLINHGSGAAGARPRSHLEQDSWSRTRVPTARDFRLHPSVKVPDTPNNSWPLGALTDCTINNRCSWRTNLSLLIVSRPTGIERVMKWADWDRCLMVSLSMNHAQKFKLIAIPKKLWNSAWRKTLKQSFLRIV